MPSYFPYKCNLKLKSLTLIKTDDIEEGYDFDNSDGILAAPAIDSGMQVQELLKSDEFLKYYAIWIEVRTRKRLNFQNIIKFL